MRELSEAEIFLFQVLFYGFSTLGLITIGFHVSHVIRRYIRCRRVRREIARMDLQAPPSGRALGDERPGGPRVPMPPMRTSDVSDSGAARVLAFQDYLAARGRYVSELTIERRLN